MQDTLAAGVALTGTGLLSSGSGMVSGLTSYLGGFFAGVVMLLVIGGTAEALRHRRSGGCFLALAGRRLRRLGRRRNGG